MKNLIRKIVSVFPKPLRDLYFNYEDKWLYIFFGGLTTVVSFVAAGFAKWVLEKWGGFGTDAISDISTVFSWVCAVTFAYLTNRVWVFDSTTKGVKNLIIRDDFYPVDAPREEIHAAMVEGLKKLAPLAEEADLTILVEPLSGKYFQDSKEAFDILREVGSKNILMLYDIFHFQQIEGNITNTIKNNIDWIGHIHGAGVPARCEITDGEVDYRFVLNVIKETGYDRYFGLEFFTFTDREDKVRKSAELLGTI